MQTNTKYALHAHARLAPLGVTFEPPVLLRLAVAGVLDQAAIVVRVEGHERIVARVRRQQDDLLVGMREGAVPTQHHGRVKEMGGEGLGVRLRGVAVDVPPVAPELADPGQRRRSRLLRRALS